MKAEQIAALFSEEIRAMVQAAEESPIWGDMELLEQIKGIRHMATVFADNFETYDPHFDKVQFLKDCYFYESWNINADRK